MIDALEEHSKNAKIFVLGFEIILMVDGETDEMVDCETDTLV